MRALWSGKASNEWEGSCYRPVTVLIKVHVSSV